MACDLIPRWSTPPRRDAGFLDPRTEPEASLPPRLRFPVGVPPSRQPYDMEVSPVEGKIFCVPCRKHITKSSAKRHKRSKSHKYTVACNRRQKYVERSTQTGNNDNGTEIFQVNDNGNEIFQVNDNGNEILPKTNTRQKSVFCVTCGKGYEKPSQLLNHIRTHFTELKLSCTICEKKFCHL